MAVVIETTLGDITVDLYVEQRPRASQNFLKLCKLKYYNFNLFHSIRSNFIAQTGDPTGEGSGGSSVWGVLEGPEKRYFSCEKIPKIRHTDAGLLSMVAVDDAMVGSQFFFTLAPNLDSLDSKHCVIGEVVEGHEVLRKLNEVICDETHRPYRDVRITHTVILEDPFNDMPGLREPSRSPSPSTERLAGGRIAPDEEINETEGKTAEEVSEMIQEKEAKARATILEIVGDLPDADMAPPENVLFVCKLNPVTTDEDLEIIFSRFGKIIGCEVIRDKKTGDSLQYAFIEFEDKKSCENAYFKMDNVLIDDRRIHVDFSQSVSKLKWRGKGKGVIHVGNEEGDHNGNDKFKNNKTKSKTLQRRRNSPDERRHSKHDSSRSNNARDEHRHSQHESSQSNNKSHRDSHEASQSSSSTRDNRDKKKESDKRKYSNNENRDQRNHKHRRRESPYRNKSDNDRYRNHSSERKTTSRHSNTTDHKKYNSSKSHDEHNKRFKSSRNHSNNKERSHTRHDNNVNQSNRRYDNSQRSKHSEMQREDPSYRSETPPPPSSVKYKDSSKNVSNKEVKKIKEKPKKKEQKPKKSKKRASSSSSSDTSDDSSSSSSDSSDSDKKKRSKKRKRKYSTSSTSSSNSSTSSSDSSSTGESTSSSSDSSDSDVKNSKKKKQVKKSKNVKKKK